MSSRVYATWKGIYVCHCQGIYVCHCKGIYVCHCKGIYVSIYMHEHTYLDYKYTKESACMYAQTNKQTNSQKHLVKYLVKSKTKNTSKKNITDMGST